MNTVLILKFGCLTYLLSVWPHVWMFASHKKSVVPYSQEFSSLYAQTYILSSAPMYLCVFHVLRYMCIWFDLHFIECPLNHYQMNWYSPIHYIFTGPTSAPPPGPAPGGPRGMPPPPLMGMGGPPVRPMMGKYCTTSNHSWHMIS